MYKKLNITKNAKMIEAFSDLCNFIVNIVNVIENSWKIDLRCPDKQLEDDMCIELQTLKPRKVINIECEPGVPIVDYVAECSFTEYKSRIVDQDSDLSVDKSDLLITKDEPRSIRFKSQISIIDYKPRVLIIEPEVVIKNNDISLVNKIFKCNIRIPIIYYNVALHILFDNIVKRSPKSILISEHKLLILHQK